MPMRHAYRKQACRMKPPPCCLQSFVGGATVPWLHHWRHQPEQGDGHQTAQPSRLSNSTSRLPSTTLRCDPKAVGPRALVIKPLTLPYQRKEATVYLVHLAYTHMRSKHPYTCAAPVHLLSGILRSDNFAEPTQCGLSNK